MNTLKWELEDLSFATLYPKRYDEIVRLVAERAPARDTLLAEVVEEVSGDLRDAKIKATVTGRPKHYYSIYQKMIVRGRDFADIYDLVGIRILVDSVRDCYAALGTMHAVWNPVPGRFKDYIAMPKFNMYQSLHTTVIGPDGKPVELQIRTHAMHKLRRVRHRRALEVQGESPRRRRAGATGEDMAWLRQMLDWQRETADPGEFLDVAALRPARRRGVRLHPQGRRHRAAGRRAPRSTSRTRVHTEVGHRCIGARVNGRLVPLETALENGDAVEIFTSKSHERRPVARLAGLRHSPPGAQQDPAVVRQGAPRGRHRGGQGRDQPGDAQAGPAAAAHALGGDALAHARAGPALPRRLGALRRGRRGPRVGADRRRPARCSRSGGAEGAVEDLAETAVPTQSRPRRLVGGDPGVVVKGVDDVWVKLARCCTPVPGDAIVGFVTRGHGVSVHRGDCLNVAAARAHRPHGRGRVGAVAASVFLVAIQVEALDRTRLLSDVTRVLSDHHVNILSASVTTTRDRVAVAGSPSRWATRSTSATCCARCATSRASTTSTGSPAARTERLAPARSGRGLQTTRHELARGTSVRSPVGTPGCRRPRMAARCLADSAPVSSRSADPEALDRRPSRSARPSPVPLALSVRLRRDGGEHVDDRPSPCRTGCTAPAAWCLVDQEELAAARVWLPVLAIARVPAG